MSNKIARLLFDKRKKKSEVKVNFKLAKNGRFATIDGVVEDIKVNRDGIPFVVFRKSDRGFQNVRLQNIMSVSTDDGKTIRRAD